MNKYLYGGLFNYCHLEWEYVFNFGFKKLKERKTVEKKKGRFVYLHLSVFEVIHQLCYSHNSNSL